MSKYFIKRADATITYVEKSSIDYTKRPYLCINYQVDNKKIEISNKCLKEEKNKSKNIHILYTGALTNIYGINKLLEVANKLPNNFVLSICGSGGCEKDVIEFQKKEA